MVGVWVGRPDGSPSPGQYGAVTAVPLMAQVLESLDTGSNQRPLPSSVTRETICWPSGLAEPQMKVSLKNQGGESVRPYISGACARRHKAWILNHQIPPTLVKETGLSAPLIQTFWTDKANRRATPLCGGIQKSSIVLWPWQAEPFIPPQWRRGRILPQNSDQCPDLAPLAAPRIRIVSVSNGSVLTRQPGSRGKIMVSLRALGGTGQVYWFLNRRVLEEKNGSTPLAMAMPDPGKYQLAVVDETGNSDQVSFQVIEP